MPPRHYTPPHPWQPMTDPEWDAIRPYILNLGSGRPIRDLRRRVEAMFWLAQSGRRWADLPEDFGKPGTVSRHFRRLTRGHLWQRLLHALADPAAPAGLKALEYRICRACRRAVRVAGLALITTARRLGFLSALRGPSWLLPDEDLSKTVLRAAEGFIRRMMAGDQSVPKGILGVCRRLLRTCAGRRYIPKCLEPA